MLSLLVLVASPPLASNDLSVKQFDLKVDDPELTVTVTSATSVLLEWDAWGGELGNYQIKVKNLSTQEIEQSFSTGALSTSVSSLSTGVTYRFSVEKNGFVIAEDVIM